MFADDTNFFLSYKNIVTLFAIMNAELETKMSQRVLSQTSCLLMLIKPNGPYFTLYQKDSFFHSLTFLLKIYI